MKDKLNELLNGLTDDEKKEVLFNSLKMLIENNEKITLTVKEAATYTGIGEHKIRELVDKQGSDFPYFKVGNKTLINKKLLDEWVDRISIEKNEI